MPEPKVILTLSEYKRLQSKDDTSTVRYNPDTDCFEVLLNGEWIQAISARAQFDGVMYEYGDNSVGLFTYYPGYGVDNGVSPSAPEFETDHIYFYSAVAPSGNAVGLRSKNKFNLTNWQKVYVEFALYGATNANKHYMNIFVDDGTVQPDTWYTYENVDAGIAVANNSATSYPSGSKVSFDVSTLSGEYYIGITFHSGSAGGPMNGKIYKVWLE